jgi:hypothetical protein
MRSVILGAIVATSMFAADVLVGGSSPLTADIVQNATGVLEWLVGGSLPAGQRARVRDAMVESWQHRNTAQMAQWVQLANLRPQLEALDENQKQALRRTLVEQLKNANVLTPAAPAATGVYSALAGKWEQRFGSSSITYQDRATGSFAAPTGNINRYVFTADGQYEYAEFHQVSTYGCTTNYFGYEKGEYAVEGDRITFTQRQHSLEFKSTCNPSLNSNKNLPLATSTYFFQVGQGQDGRELVVTDGKTARWRFRRAE